MKNTFTFLMLVLCTSFAFAQYSEDFEGDLSAWTLESNWVAGNNTAIQSQFFGIPDHTKFIGINDDAAGQGVTLSGYAISPSITVPQEFASLNFEYYFVNGDYQNADEIAQVFISSDGGTNWVLLQDLGAVTDGAAWDEVSISLEAYAGQEVQIAFFYDDGAGWNFGYCVDDVEVKSLDPNDVSIKGVGLSRYSLVSINNVLEIDIANEGGEAVTSVEVNWNDGVDHFETVDIDVPAGGEATVFHPIAINYSEIVEKTIEVSVSKVNGNDDANPEDNAVTRQFNTLSQEGKKKVLIEEGTGTWCPWCTRGIVAMDYMYDTYPETFVGIAVHNNDPMTLAAYDNAVALTGYPGCNVDRAILNASVSQGLFEEYYNERIAIISPADLDAEIAVSGSEMSIDATAVFYTNFESANYRMGVIISESDVTGTSSGYNQANAYAGGGNGPMGGYESLPNPVPAADMVYDHVGRALVGGYDGQVGSIPASIENGVVNEYFFNYTVPAGYDVNNMSVVLVLIDQATGEVVTAEEIKYDGASSANEEVLEDISLSVYPNPVVTELNVSFEAEGDYNVSLFNMAGQVVLNQMHKNLSGAQTITLPVDGLTAGQYMVTVSNTKGSFTKIVTVK